MGFCRGLRGGCRKVGCGLRLLLSFRGYAELKPFGGNPERNTAICFVPSPLVGEGQGEGYGVRLRRVHLVRVPAVAPGILPPATLVHPCTSPSRRVTFEMSKVTKTITQMTTPLRGSRRASLRCGIALTAHPCAGRASSASCLRPFGSSLLAQCSASSTGFPRAPLNLAGFSEHPTQHRLVARYRSFQPCQSTVRK